jgi:hypothetical protein
METNLLDLGGTVVAVVLTLFVFSYLLGDNILYRLTEHIFVGVSIGYAAVVAFHAVLASKLFTPLATAISEGNSENIMLLIVPLVLGLFLLTKPFRSISWLGSISVAWLLGVGAALAIGGALLGTLLPQMEATADLRYYVTRYEPGLGLFSGLLVLVSTIGVLLHFYFGREQGESRAGIREGMVRVWGGLGRWFILIAFGAILATTFTSRLSLLVGRMQFLLDSVRGLLGG